MYSHDFFTWIELLPFIENREIENTKNNANKIGIPTSTNMPHKTNKKL